MPFGDLVGIVRCAIGENYVQGDVEIFVVDRTTQIADYFGAVQIKRIRHALWAGLTADAAGIIAAVLICSLLFAA